MNKKNVMKVVKRLRSGEFVQIHHQLRNQDNGRCCLGVACEVYQEEVGGHWEQGKFRPKESGDWSSSLLPTEVQEWLGFEVIAGPPVCGRCSSSAANDAGKSFTEIADEWEKLCNEEN